MMRAADQLTVDTPPRQDTVSLVVKGYFDGSVTGPYVTLAGFAGSIAAWHALYGTWNEVVERWLQQGGPHFDFMHMTDAHALRGQFSPENGWTEDLVKNLVDRFFRDCLHPVCLSMKDQMRAVSVTVNSDEYSRAQSMFSALSKVKPLHAICVDGTVTVALSLLDDDPIAASGKRGKVELIFDRTEPFVRWLHRVWDGNKKRNPYAHLIASITASSAEDAIGIQAADMMAWSANAGYSRKDARHLLFPILTTGAAHVMVTYDRIESEYRKACELLGRSP